MKAKGKKYIVKKILIIVFIITLIGLVGKWEHIYYRKVQVINLKEDRVICQDTNGYLWEFIGEGYKVKQSLKLKMDDNNTSSIYDDRVIEVIP